MADKKKNNNKSKRKVNNKNIESCNLSRIALVVAVGQFIITILFHNLILGIELTILSLGLSLAGKIFYNDKLSKLMIIVNIVIIVGALILLFLVALIMGNFIHEVLYSNSIYPVFRVIGL